MPTYPVTVIVDNPDGCLCPTCPPPPPLPCPACESGFPVGLVVTVGGAANTYTLHTWSPAYGVITVEGDLTFKLNGTSPEEFDASGASVVFRGALTAGGYEIKAYGDYSAAHWALYRSGVPAPIPNLVPQTGLPGGAAANDGQSTHLRLVWDSAAGTVTGYAASPGQPEEMIGRFTDQWTPYSSSACLGGFDLGGEAFTGFSGSTVVTAENLTEACGGGMLMARPARAPAPVPLPCVHEGHTRPGPNGPDGKTYLGCDAGMGDPPGTVCRCACGPGCDRYEADE